MRPYVGCRLHSVAYEWGVNALKEEPLTRETASKTDENDSLWPHERFFSSLVFATVAHSALISLALQCLAQRHCSRVV